MDPLTLAAIGAQILATLIKNGVEVEDIFDSLLEDGTVPPETFARINAKLEASGDKWGFQRPTQGEGNG